MSASNAQQCFRRIKSRWVMCCLPFAKAHLYTAGQASHDAKVLVVPGASLGTRTGAAGLCRAVPQGMSQLAQLRSLGPLLPGPPLPGPPPLPAVAPKKKVLSAAVVVGSSLAAVRPSFWKPLQDAPTGFLLKRGVLAWEQ